MRWMVPVMLLSLLHASAGHFTLKDARPPRPSGTDATGIASDAIQHGTIEHYRYTTVVGRNLPRGEEDHYVYTPAGYDPTSSIKYPVLYLLHGFDQGSASWLKQGNARSILDDLIAQGNARPMIVVMPLGYGDYNFVRGGKVGWLSPLRVDGNVSLFSRMLLDEIVPRVESAYRVSRKREDRAIAGLSMGGREAVSIGLAHPKQFAWVGGFSAAFPDVERYRAPAFEHGAAEAQRVWMACGVADHLVFKGNMRVIADLNGQGRSVTSVVTHGTHAWPVWRADLKQFLPLLFQDN